jgi:hypothetical protein
MMSICMVVADMQWLVIANQLPRTMLQDAHVMLHLGTTQFQEPPVSVLAHSSKYRQTAQRQDDQALLYKRCLGQCAGVSLTAMRKFDNYTSCTVHSLRLHAGVPLTLAW